MFPSNSSFPIPEDYKVLEVLGQGFCGKVIKCVKRETGEIVAVKIPTLCNIFQIREAKILKILKNNKLNNCNIIEYKGEFNYNNTTNLVLEFMDMTLFDYMVALRGPMQLEDVRKVIHQLAVAFDALKGCGVIHSDVKLDNIMMVDRLRQPFKVKLIDFGLALSTGEAVAGRIVQNDIYRAPEVRLRLPFSEAIDIWSLGCLMAEMAFHFELFPGESDYEAFKYMIDLLGPPPDHLLNATKKSGACFTERDGGGWRLQTPGEFLHRDTAGFDDIFKDARSYNFRSLDEMKTVRLEKDNPTEADERREFIELMKAMLQWDANDRITPSGILNHPFITKCYLNSRSPLSFCCNKPEPSTSQAQKKIIRRTTVTITTTVKDCSSEALPPAVILVQPADPKNQSYLGDRSSVDNDLNLIISAAPTSSLHVNSVHQDPELPANTCDDCKDEQQKMTKKKKKNCFRRFFSWMRRKFHRSAVAPIM